MTKKTPSATQWAILSLLAASRGRRIGEKWKPPRVSAEYWHKQFHDWQVIPTGKIVTRRTVQIMRQRGWLKAVRFGWAISASGRRALES